MDERKDGTPEPSNPSVPGDVLAEFAPHPYQSLDADGTIRSVNDAWVDTFGYEREAVVGEPFTSLLGADSRERFERLFRTFKERGSIANRTLTVRRNDGRSIEVALDGHIEYTEDGAVRRTHCQFNDVTKSDEQDQQLNVYRHVVESSTDMLAAIDRNHDLLIANERYREFHGIPTDEPLEGRNLQEVVGPEEYAETEPHLERALEGEPVSYETTRTDEEGNERVVDIGYYPLRNDDGTIIGSIKAMRDVTDEHKRTEAIRELSEYRRIMSRVNHWLVRSGSTRKMLPKVTQAIESSDHFGCTFFALVGDVEPSFVCTSESELDEEDVKAFHTPAYVRQVFEDGVLRIEDVTAPPFEQHVDDRPSHAGVALAVTHGGNEYGILTVHLPPEVSLDEVHYRLLNVITEDLGFFIYSQSVEHNYRTFHEIAERISDPIMLQNLDGEYEVINAAVSEYANRSRDALLGADEFEFMGEDVATEIQERKRQVIESEAPVRYSVDPVLPTKGRRNFSTIRYPHYNESGELDGTVAICRDITDTKDRERQLQVMDRVLRHNVNNNMTVIKGFAETIQAFTTDERAADQARKIIHHSERLTNLVEKERKITALLSDSPNVRPMDLVSLVKPAVEDLEAELPDIDLRTDLPQECAVQGTDTVELAVHELLSNAVVHSDSDRPTISVQITEDDDAVVLRIADEGPRIPAMERKVLTSEATIEPLYHGSGLGLWLVHLIVNQVEGSLEFDENDPQGNVVTIRFQPA